MGNLLLLLLTNLSPYTLFIYFVVVQQHISQMSTPLNLDFHKEEEEEEEK